MGSELFQFGDEFPEKPSALRRLHLACRFGQPEGGTPAVTLMPLLECQRLLDPGAYGHARATLLERCQIGVQLIVAIATGLAASAAWAGRKIEPPASRPQTHEQSSCRLLQRRNAPNRITAVQTDVEAEPPAHIIRRSCSASCCLSSTKFCQALVAPTWSTGAPGYDHGE